MKVLLVDDSAVVRTSFGGLVGSIPGVELVGCADDVASACSLVHHLAPDLVVLDLQLRQGERGIDVLREVTRTRPDAVVVVLSNGVHPALQGELRGAGAAALFDKAIGFRLALDWIAARAASSTPATGRPGAPGAR